MDPVAIFIVVVFALSLFVAVTGQRWGLAFPVGAGLLGIVLFAAGEPTGPGGGDADPQRLIGGALMIIAVPWALVYAVVAAARRRPSRR
jgi:hypothetical protein